jgi:signal transduction histidine kinase
MSSVRNHIAVRARAWRQFPGGFDGRPLAVFTIAAVALTAIGWLDYTSGPLISMELLYLVPVGCASAVGGWRVGIAAAALATALGFLADVVLQPHYAHRTAAALNVGFVCIILLVVVVLVHRLRQRALEAIEAEKRSREFLGFAAHQLRTPLAGVSGIAEALLIDVDDEREREQLLVQLSVEATRAGRLIASLLRVERLDQHEPLPLRPVDLRALVCDEIDRAARRYPQVAWDVHISPTLAPRLQCSPDALAEAIANLLDNAGRFARARVSIHLGAEGQTTELVVSDDGPGLPLGKVDVAFERFVTLDGTGTGTGLGLPIAQGIAEAHGGALIYEAGAFRMRIPTPATRVHEEPENAARRPRARSRSRVRRAPG